jgi:DNA-binding SARP family transcriptional activator
VNSSIVAMKVRIPHAPSMPLDRLDAQLDAVWRARLGLVVAPAGSGKTTLLSRLALRAPGPVGWYRAESWDREEAALVSHLEAALVPGIEGVERGWRSVADAANALEAWHGAPILLVIDDLHTLEETPAESALQRFIDYAPPSLTVVLASRVPPHINLSRLRVSGGLLELSGDDLRFRSWEVERLFRDFYEEPLPPEELARLARRTEGWAAGLQLFHLAIRGRTPDERRRLLAELGAGSRITSDYLTRNVLGQLPADLRRFLVDTSVLGRLSGPLCDRLLETRASGAMLRELERRRLFTQPLPESGVYRYHEVLRSHLQAVLLEELGQDGFRQRFVAAGEILADAGAVAEALEAFCRGEDWERARRLLDGNGQSVAEGMSIRVDGLPPAMVLHDPWLLLASARRLRNQGRFAEAINRYQRAESFFGSSEPAEICHAERTALGAWSEPSTVRPEPLGLLRQALRSEPLGVAREARQLPPATGAIVAGLAALLAGHVATARGELLHAAERSDAGRYAQMVAALGAGAAGLLMGQQHAAVEVEGAVAAAEAAGFDWLSRLGRSALALSGAPELVREAETVAAASQRLGAEWGEVLARICAAWGTLVEGSDVSGLDGLAAKIRGVDAPVLETWMHGIDALAAVRSGEPDSREAALLAESSARASGVDAARMLAYLALAGASPEDSEAEQYRSVALDLAAEIGLSPPLSDSASGDAAAMDAAGDVPLSAPPLVIHLLGGFEMSLAGREVDLRAVRPRARALLRLLCLHAGAPVHHETIEAALWPSADAESSSRNLHVAIAALRRLLEPAAMRGSFQLLRRDGDAYRLVMPVGGEVDLLRFEQAIRSGRAAEAQGDATRAVAAYRNALELYRGELLPEDGPAEWVAERRDGCRLAAVGAAQSLAQLLLQADDSAGAAEVCNAGLRIERYHDPLWRLLIRARDMAGDQGAASRARLAYDRMLAELGVPASIS